MSITAKLEQGKDEDMHNKDKDMNKGDKDKRERVKGKRKRETQTNNEGQRWGEA
jgi:hypothetical protein